MRVAANSATAVAYDNRLRYFKLESSPQKIFGFESDVKTLPPRVCEAAGLRLLEPDLKFCR
jgi:hypothetical protein